MSWIKCSDRMPTENQAVIWYEPVPGCPTAWIGDYSTDGGDAGLAPMRSYEDPWWNASLSRWQISNAEWVPDYQPTHWHPLPDLPEDKEATDAS